VGDADTPAPSKQLTGSGRSPNVLLGALVVAAFPMTLLQAVLSPALPAIEREYSASPAGVSWLVTAYLLTGAVATPITGKLGGLFGKRRVLLASLCILVVGVVICALAPTLGWMIIGRFVQGCGAGIFPLVFGIIREQMPPDRIATSVGAVSALYGVGGITGVIMAGPVVDTLGFHWLFWIAMLVILAGIAMTLRFIPDDPGRSSAHINWFGALLMSASLIGLLVGLSQGRAWGWTSPRVLALFGIAVLAGALWVMAELRVPEPIVDMRMLVRATVWRANACAFLVGFAMWVPFALVPLAVQSPPNDGFGLGLSASAASMLQLPVSVATLVAGPLAGRMDRRFGSRLPMIVGPLMIALAMAVWAFAHGSGWMVVLTQTVAGIGLGFALAAATNLTIEGVAAGETAVATSINQIARFIGGAFGAQIVGTVLTANVLSTGFASEGAFQAGCLIDVAVMIVAAGIALSIPRRVRHADSLPDLRPAVA
jgi:EmrB/QacA subfamily drug resistance transporter